MERVVEAGRSRVVQGGDSPSWARVELLLDEVLEMDEATRARWLEAARHGDALQREVVQLLGDSGQQGVLDRAIPVPIVSLDGWAELEPRLRRALEGRYRVDRCLGEGGTAHVYLAHEAKHDRAVVLKVLKQEAALWIGAERFRSEIQILAQLSHPHIVPLIDSGEVDGQLYYVMPYLGGETLRERLRGSIIGAETARAILTDVARALAHAHAAGIVHRDLKPANVLCLDGHTYLMDFGIARSTRAVTRLDATQEGVAIGTPEWMAPEQRAGRGVDARTDTYAFGLLARAVLAHSTADARTPHLERLVTECLREDPAGRPADGADLLRRLGAIEQRRTTRWHRAANRAAWLVAGAVTVGMGAWWAWRRPAIDAATLPAPVVVAPFRNETGDSTLGVWGRMAGDWLTQGLLEAEGLAVVPWPVALQASGQTADSADAIGALMRETRARAVLTGAYYLAGDRVQFQAQLTDANGQVLAALPAVEASRDSIAWGIQDLRDRLRGMIALRTDDQVQGFAIAERPPLFAAYQDFERGISAYNAQRYDEAILALSEAWRRDSTFDAAAVYLARSLWNAGHRARVDSLLTAVRARPLPMSPYLDAQLRFLEHTVAGNGALALAAIREAAERAPGGRDGYNVGSSALALGQPAEAERVLRTLDPDRGALRGWAPYFYALTHALHLQGKFGEEWRESVELRRRFPQSRPSWVHLVRAAAAQGRTTTIDSLLTLAAPEAPDTYWSQGAVMVTAAEELEAHGYPERAPAYYARAEQWLANQLTRNPTHDAHRYWMGSALYDQGRWADARPYFESLRDETPDELRSRGPVALIEAREGNLPGARAALGAAEPFQETELLVFQARLAGIAGDTAASLSYWQQAISRGLSGVVWQHHSVRRDLAPLVGNPVARQLGLVVR